MPQPASQQPLLSPRCSAYTVLYCAQRGFERPSPLPPLLLPRADHVVYWCLAYTLGQRESTCRARQRARPLLHAPSRATRPSRVRGCEGAAPGCEGARVPPLGACLAQLARQLRRRGRLRRCAAAGPAWWPQSRAPDLY
jgi:hypothetical protein